ncbi:hypothetical protein BC938DRAFT_481753 [Jimgerdemannia flammicorona]|uniref:Anaphase-promoting complex subunit 11 n=1 Tax=Jimgerdemannia flammicorona TaxID=994334 RepID=A0A433QFH2_9FUNG|nr:hypothetical protein BC938DRAFT_481753 [Jimgerdemannia flammicorona]
MPTLTLHRLDIPTSIPIKYKTGKEDIAWLCDQAEAVIAASAPLPLRHVKLLLDGQVIDRADNWRSLDYFIATPGCWFVWPVFTGPSEEMLVHIKNLTGQVTDYVVNIEDTVLDLKCRIRDREGVPPEQQWFLYFGRDLNDESRTLSEYEVLAGVTIHLVVQKSKGELFSDLTNGKGLKIRPWSNDAPQWKYMTDGLNLEGICTNPSCDAQNQRVIIPWGHRNFDFALDEHRCTCPICDDYVTPITCAFSNTWWNFCGLKTSASEKPSRAISGSWRHAGNAYHAIDESESRIATWERLKILVRGDNPSTTCSVCLACKVLGDDGKVVTPIKFKCGHSFHGGCIEAWKVAQIEMGSKPSCPICRKTIIELEDEVAEDESGETLEEGLPLLLTETEPATIWASQIEESALLTPATEAKAGSLLELPLESVPEPAKGSKEEPAKGAVANSLATEFGCIVLSQRNLIAK